MRIIDGSHQEGGGQIIRTAVALSALTGKAVKIEKIRAGRPNPGLQAQHIAAVEAVAKLCNAEARGLEIGSQTLEFIPKKIFAERIDVKIPTAGSVGLVLQALLIPAAFAEKPLKIRIEGGSTFGKWAPPVQYLQNVISPILSRAGYSFKINILRHGFYPAGGAVVEAETTPAKFRKFEFMASADAKLSKPSLEMESRGEERVRRDASQSDLGKSRTSDDEIKRIRGISIASTHLKNARVAERQKDAVIQALENYGKTVEIKTEYVEASSPGSGIVLFAEYDNSVLGADALGERGKSAESVGGEAAKKLLKQIDSGACLDEWMADQVIPYLALAGGAVKVAEITPHAETNIWVVEQFLDARFDIDRKNNILRAAKSKGS